MSSPIRIANCSGFFGDRLSAAREMVDGGPIDVLTGDWLAELTLWILARQRERRPDGGYAHTFMTQLEEVMAPCLERGVKVVSNAGGLDPRGCALAVRSLAQELGLQPRIAYVEGDDLRDRLPQLIEARHLRRAHGSEAIPSAKGILSANAYLGGWGIAEALRRGADIVITGRVTDAALVCGPAAWHHGWGRTDWDALAGAVAAGHVIECGAQATGGNYAFFTEVPDITRVGFPWAEIEEDGSSRIGKHAGTGGEVSVGTVTSQLLYEIDTPRYLGPDVTTRFDTIRLEAAGPDRVRLFGVRGEPPPATLKVCLIRDGGYRNSVRIGLTGLDIEAKAALLERSFWAACPFAASDYGQVITRLVRTDRPDPPSNEQAVAVLEIGVRDDDRAKVGRAFSNTAIELALASIPGFFAPDGAPPRERPVGLFEAATVPSEDVPQKVVLLGEEPSFVSSVIPAKDVFVAVAEGPHASCPSGATVQVPFGRVFGTRSGDKGPDANLGVFARSDAGWAWLDARLDVELLRRLLPELAPLPLERYRLPALRSLNFVIRGLLGEGAAAATRQDPQAKSLGEWLRARSVELLRALLEDGGATNTAR